MKYITINKNNENFYKITLNDILSIVETQKESFLWRIEYIDAVGNITDVTGMSMVEFEKKCNKSNNEMPIDFQLIKDIANACDDIIDILIIGNNKNNPLPKRTLDVEKIDCDIIISFEDSSSWELYSIIQEQMSSFEKLKTMLK